MSINKNGFYVVHNWMVSKLGLTGTEKDLYAIIYGFSQDGESQFYGSVDYLKNMLGISDRAVQTNLKSLTEKGLLQVTNRSGTTGIYKAVTPEDISPRRIFTPEESSPPPPKNLHPTPEESSPYNIENTKEDKIDNIPYNDIFDSYSEICVSLKKLRDRTEGRKKTIRARWNDGYRLEDFIEVFNLAEASDFISGRIRTKGSGHDNWSPDIDWLLNPNNFTKVREGKYNNRGSSTYHDNIQELPKTKEGTLICQYREEFASVLPMDRPSFEEWSKNK